MKKLEYIQPNIKIHVKVAHSLLAGTNEHGMDAGDGEAKGVNFIDDENANAWENVNVWE